MKLETRGFLADVRLGSPKLWAALESARDEGLIFIDESNDALCPTNRLLLTYPDLHGILNQIVDIWSRNRAGAESLATLLALTGEKQ